MHARSVAVGLALLLALGLAPGSRGNDLAALVEGTFADVCQGAPEPAAEGCATGGEVAGGVVGGLERLGGGISWADCTDDAECEVEVADFYFSPRVTVVDDGQEVTWFNENGPGGNRHSVMSSDWNSAQPVLPVPGVNFGGGASFRAALQPQGSFSLEVNVLDLEPESVVRLPDGSALIPYHCYIHGAAMMQAWLLVRAG